MCSATKSDDDERRKPECDKTQKRIRSLLEDLQQGVAIQTDCSLMGGDSGGPLVNTRGELVGLNQSIRDVATFHVHRRELAEFVEDVPDKALVLVPDPFCAGEPDVTLEGADMDGRRDVVAAASTGFVMRS